MNIYGELRGVIVAMDKNSKGNVFEVLSKRGRVCTVYDLFNHLNLVEIGTRIYLEEADVSFDNGEIQYMVDENLRGVYVGKEAEELLPNS